MMAGGPAVCTYIPELVDKISIHGHGLKFCFPFEILFIQRFQVAKQEYLLRTSVQTWQV